VEQEEEPQIEMERVMLGGNMLNDEEEAMVSKNRQFVQELKVSQEPEVTQLKMHVGGDIDRENAQDTGAIYSMTKNTPQYEVQNQPGMHMQYQTGEGENIKLAFGPEDQIIEHIFTMHWSQIDKILIRAKVAGKVAPPSKRMTILDVGTDVYSQQRILLGGENNISQRVLQVNDDENLVRETRGISEIKKFNMGQNGNDLGNQTKGEITEIVTEMIIGGGDNDEHMNMDMNFRYFLNYNNIKESYCCS
jgi:hypothetical protein